MTKPIEQTVASPTHFIVSDGTAEESNVGPATIETMAALIQPELELTEGPQGEPGTDGDDGASAYEIAVANGFEGDKTEWLASLVGPAGDQGPKGDTGDQGVKGDTGDEGSQGDPGPNEVTTATATDITGLLKGDGASVSAAVAGTDYQAALVSGTNIKTINSTSLLGSGDIVVGAGINGGTAAAPGLAVVGDSDTGIYSDAANAIGISAGGVQAMGWATSAGVPTSHSLGTLYVGPTTTQSNATSQIHPLRWVLGIDLQIVGIPGSQGALQAYNGVLISGGVGSPSASPTAITLQGLNSPDGIGCVIQSHVAQLSSTRGRGDLAVINTSTYNRDFAIALGQRTSTGQYHAQQTIKSEWVDNTTATRKARAIENIHDTDAREVSRSESDGTRGYKILKAHSTAPSDSMLPNSSVCFYEDGSGNLAIKLKDSSGTVKTGTVTLS